MEVEEFAQTQEDEVISPRHFGIKWVQPPRAALVRDQGKPGALMQDTATSITKVRRSSLDTQPRHAMQHTASNGTS